MSDPHQPHRYPPLPALLLDPVPLQRLRQLGGDSFARKMVTLFLEQTPDRLNAGAAALAQADWAGIERCAHALASSAGQLGACQLQQLAARVEQACATGHTHLVGGLFRQLAQAWEEVRGLLLPLVDQG